VFDELANLFSAFLHILSICMLQKFGVCYQLHNYKTEADYEYLFRERVAFAIPTAQS